MAPRSTHAYRFDIIDGQNTCIRSDARDCHDDLDALDHAYALCSTNDVELWCGERYVAYVRRGSTLPVVK